MAEGDLIVGPWQAELRGELFEGLTSSGPFPVTEWLSGLGVPDSRMDTVPLPSEHGVFPGAQFLGPRSIRCQVAARGASGIDVEAAAKRLAAAWAPVGGGDTDTIPLAFRLADSTVYRVYGKPTRLNTRWETLLEGHDAGDTWLIADCEFLASDPRIYANAGSSGSASVGTTTGGLGFPMGHPYGFGSATPGAITAVNAGNFPTYPVLTVTAGASPITTPITIYNLTTGETFRYAGSLSAGEVLVIDLGQKDVGLTTGTGRLNNVDWTVSSWWDLEPGTNELSWSVGAGPTATLDVEWRSAWML